MDAEMETMKAEMDRKQSEMEAMMTKKYAES